MDQLDALRLALADRYGIERELGQGGMATVYLARDLKHEREVALKVLRPELAQFLGRDRFLREIRTTAQLTHPHILPLLDSGEAAGTLYYVMPYVEGESLRGRLEREKQLPLDDALQIAREVADGLSYAHSHGVVHRDIKPENILLESGHAVVADFGIARAIDAAGGERLTETGLAIGTPAYMSPEQAAGSKDLDGRSDLYALGCVLFEMLAGQPPFTGPTAETIIHQHLAAGAPSITGLRPAVPASVAAALQRSLAKTPADRFNPVALFAEALGGRASAGVATPLAPAATPFPAASAAGTTPGAATAPAIAGWWSRRGLALLGLAVVIVVVAVVAVGRWLRPGAPGSHYPRTAIAVLPLENLSAEGPHSYFAGGLHDELLTELAKVAALSVRPRTSVMGYAGTTKPMKVIGQELAVGSVVEGSVQVEGNRLRVNVQLIDPVTEAHIWAEHYDRTLDDAFAVQSEIAQRIVEAVGATLTGAEAGAIAAAPTANAEAYQLFLQGREYYSRPGYLRRNYESAQQLFERALALDPGFALAHAALSEVHGFMYFFQYDPSPVRATRQREEAEAALRLAPDLAEAHVASGLAYYRGQRDYRRAMEEFRIALKGLPNDVALWSAIGAVQRRLGNWNDALMALEKAEHLDPRNADLVWDLGGNTYRVMHRYAEAVREYNRALSLAPDLYGAAVRKGTTFVLWQGQLDTLRTVLSRLPSDAGDTKVGGQLALFLWARQPDSVLQVLPAASAGVFQRGTFRPMALYAAWAHQLRGDRAAARAAFDSARVVLDSVVRALPNNAGVHGDRGMTLAGLGRRAEALSEARWLEQSVDYRQDAFSGPGVAQMRAEILAQAGDADAALGEIERLLARPSYLTVHDLQVDWRWDPLRNDPRFQALLRRYGG